MNILRRRRWESRESEVTPEHVFWNRRRVLAMGGGAAAAAAIGGGASAEGWLGYLFGESDDAIPAPAAYTPTPPLNPDFADAGRPITDEQVNSTYNNFYEFGSHKRIYAKAQALQTDPWTLQIDGEVEKPMSIAFEDLMSRVQVEERIVRHRCVEAWAMVAPWIGFKLSDLMAIAAPLSSAKYVRFETFFDPDIAEGQRASWSPWPYVEGLTMAEAANPLSFMVVGAYGKHLHKQFGAPIRLHTPWKYGFKHIKSIVRISFTTERPVSFWEELQSREYGFWANVNPDVSHPRWSQASERMLGTDERVPTVLFNGYGPEVAHLYAGLEATYADRLWR